MIGSVHIAHPEKAPSSNTKQISEAMLSCTKGAPEAFLRAENTPQMQYLTHRPYFDKNYQVTKLQGCLKPEGCSLGPNLGTHHFHAFWTAILTASPAPKFETFCTKLCPLGVIIKPFFRSHNSILLRSHNNTSFKRNNFTYFRSSNSTSSELFLNLINWSHSECDYATAKIEPRLKALPSATKQTRQHLLLPRFVGEIRSILPALVPTLHNSFSGTGTGGGAREHGSRLRRQVRDRSED